MEDAPQHVHRTPQQKMIPGPDGNLSNQLISSRD